MTSTKMLEEMKMKLNEMFEKTMTGRWISNSRKLEFRTPVRRAVKKGESGAFSVQLSFQFFV